jgi:hypothetical protein
MTEPTRKDRLRPAELLGFCGVLAVFTGVVVLLSTRDIALAAIGLGITFIVAVVVVVMLLLTGKPKKETPDEDASGQ